MRRGRTTGLNFGRRRKKLNIPLLKEIITWSVEIAIVLVMAFVLVYFVGLRTSVVGSSMSDTLEAGDEILVNRFVYKVTAPKRGDVIVFLPNGNKKSHYYVKRVIGVPGDTIQIKNGILYVNGEEYKETPERDKMDEAGPAKEEITVGEDEYFVLGDNRNNRSEERR